MPTTPDVNNVKLGSCGVLWGTDDLGYTKGGVDVKISTMTKDVMVDQFGPSAINRYITGRMVEVTVNMAESDLAKLALALPGSTLTENGAKTKRKLVVKNAAGTDLRAIAKKLVLHPTGALSTAKNDDFIVLLAAPIGDMEFSFNFEDERVYAVTFVGFPDNVTGELFLFGDEVPGV